METEKPKSQEEFDALVREESDRLSKEINDLPEKEKRERIESIRTVIESYGIESKVFSPEELIFLFVQKEAEKVNK